jgi:hypothetical protein
MAISIHLSSSLVYSPKPALKGTFILQITVYKEHFPISEYCI